MQILDNVATLDDFASAVTLEQDTADTVAFVIANASAVAQFRPVSRRGGAEQAWTQGLLITPQSGAVHNVSGVRFRSAIAGTPARIVAALTGPEDPQITGGTPFTQTLAAGGSVSQIQVLPRIALANFPPASPQDGQEIALAVDASHEWHLIYNATTGYWDYLGGPGFFVSFDANAVANTLTQVGVTNYWYRSPEQAWAAVRPGDYHVDGRVGLDPNADGNIKTAQIFSGNALVGTSAVEWPWASAAGNFMHLDDAADVTGVPLAGKIGIAIGGGGGQIKMRATKITVTPLRIQ